MRSTLFSPVSRRNTAVDDVLVPGPNRSYQSSCSFSSSLLKVDRAEQRLRMCRDGRGLGSKLVSFSKGFSKHPHILAIIKVDSEYLRFSFKLKVDYFMLCSVLVSTLVICLLLFSMNKRRRPNEASLQ